MPEHRRWEVCGDLQFSSSPSLKSLELLIVKDQTKSKDLKQETSNELTLAVPQRVGRTNPGHSKPETKTPPNHPEQKGSGNPVNHPAISSCNVPISCFGEAPD